MSECASKGCGCTTEPIIQPTAPAPLATGSAQAVYRIENMDCPTEEALIRSKLAGLAGVAGLEFNLMQRTYHHPLSCRGRGFDFVRGPAEPAPWI
ncbi:hypothetical protein L373_05588 [Klebsiella michiganensis]|uniref:Uncharacterized protein n=1 Tax=Klebsiella michiganensis TaxID=1134687 RepID=A0A7H5A0S0_9ENTR|nr:hypothetical protein L373_05588 [Klebsiella michiganensis]